MYCCYGEKDKDEKQNNQYEKLKMFPTHSTCSTVLCKAEREQERKSNHDYTNVGKMLSITQKKEVFCSGKLSLHPLL